MRKRIVEKTSRLACPDEAKHIKANTDRITRDLAKSNDMPFLSAGDFIGHNMENLNFCSEYGKSLITKTESHKKEVCGECRIEVSPKEKYCVNCGSSL